jgi:predicted ATP-dependent endonuclease of OLD family
MHIVGLEIQNFKRIVAVQITPDGRLVVVGGLNRQGKTSVLDAIEATLGGKRSAPPRPVRNGQKCSRIVLKTDGDEARQLSPLIVTRTFEENGKSQLEIRTADGYKAPSPQAILDDLYSQVAFDPLAFTRLKPKEQADSLRELVGLDFSKLDEEYKRVYDERAGVNKQGVEMAARFKAMPLNEDAPEQEVSVSELVGELDRRQQLNYTNAKIRGDLDIFRNLVRGEEMKIQDLKDEIAALQQRLAAKEESLAKTRSVAEAKAAEVAALVDMDTDSIRQQIKDAESINAKVRANRQRVELETSLSTKREESANLTARLKEIDASKAQQMAEAKWPVPGLGFDSDGITLNGLPFEQASSAEQLRVSVAIGVAMNPTLRLMLIRDGSLLDEEHLEIVRQMAEEFDTQVFLERVSEGSECSVIIADGQVKEPVAKPSSNGTLFKE